MKIRDTKSYLIVLMVICMVLYPFSSINAYTHGDTENPLTVSMNDQRPPAEKISSTVEEDMSKKDMVEVIVEMKEQVDSEEVAKNAVNNLAKSATAYEKKMASRFAVVDALRQTAEESQRDILNYLEQEQLKGNVEEYESFYIMNVVYVKANKNVIENLAKKHEVEKIDINKQIEVEWPEVEPMQKANNTIDNVEWNIDRIGAPAVWDTYGLEGTGAVVGIIDSGVHWEHEALKDKWRGYDPNDPSNPNPVGNWFDAVEGRSMPYDLASVPHGSHVAGTILGQDPEGANKIGVAPGAQWIAARAFTESGGSQAHLLAAGQFMLAPNDDPTLAPDIVNNSWGGGPGLNEWYRPMVQNWRAAGILPVFSAGNTSGGSSPGSVSAPSNYPESFSIAATDINNLRANFSNQGPGPYPDDLKPDIAAPGANIRSSVPGGYEAGWSGTSMSAPAVAGTAALLLSLDASLTPDQLEEIMMETATPLTDNQYPEAPNYGYGHGLVNAFDAVSAIASGRGVIEGSVLREGSDTEAPVIEHEPIDQAFSGLSIPIQARVTDDIAVTKVELWINPAGDDNWIMAPMERMSGDHTDGIYAGAIPFMFIEEPGFQYQIRAYDFGQNLAETDLFDVEVQFGIVPGEYYTDFSEFPVGWNLDGDWNWGAPTVGPNPVVGEKLLATNPFGNYSDNSDSQMLMPPLDLRNASEASVRLNHWYDIENNFDEGIVAVTNDFGLTWNIVGEYTGRDAQWRNMFINLNDYAYSENPVFVLFAFFSDGSVNYPGWYLDNVQLVGVDTEAPGEPTDLEANAHSTGITLDWTAPTAPDVAGYNIYRSQTSGGGYGLIGSSTTSTFTDTELEEGEDYYYVVTAYDFSDNESGYSNEASASAPYFTIIYFSDFEEDNGGWITDGANNSWEWGVPTTGPGSAFSGTKVWATNLSGDYPNNTNSWIESPEIDLTGYTTADLSFYHWFNCENRWDNAFVRISADGGETWDELATYTGDLRGWDNVNISLNDYVDETVKLRFVMESDGSVTGPGWYVDDVMISSSDAPQNPTAPAEGVQTHKTNKPESRTIDFKLQHNPENYNYEKTMDNEVADTSGLPLDAVVTIVETGRSVRTNPADGSYRMIHAASEEGQPWTLKVESYGYYSQTANVELNDGDEITQNFILDSIPKGTIAGQVVNQRTGEPIEDALVKLIGDSRIPSVTTDEEGDFVIPNVLVGEYSLQVGAANYILEEVDVEVASDETTEVIIELRPFIGFNDEIAYDDGTAENARAFFDGGNGWAMRMTPNGYAQVTGANVYLWGSDWPVPGGNEFSVAVYDSLPNGEPGEMVISPVEVEGVRGQWNHVDLSAYGFSTDRDFYLVMIQVADDPHAPGMGMDEDGPFADRSYMVVDGGFQKLDSTFGNVMLRAEVAYSLDAPVLLNPVDQTYTNEDTIMVSGTVNVDCTVNIYNNGELVAELETEDGEFNVEIDLEEGENIITATAVVEAGETDPSAPIRVVKDTVAPEVVIESPVDGFITNKELVTVTGTVEDANLDTVTINGEEATIEDGRFSTRLILEQGENLITIIATDLAGNETTQEITVIVDLVLPTITDIHPSEDITVEAGDEVTISFTSDKEGGMASFRIILPTGNYVNSTLGTPMIEVEPGVYQGTWVVPEGLLVTGATVEVELYDVAGNRATGVAMGSITVVSPEDPEDPVDPTDPVDPVDPTDPKDSDDKLPQTGQRGYIYFLLLGLISIAVGTRFVLKRA